MKKVGKHNIKIGSAVVYEVNGDAYFGIVTKFTWLEETTESVEIRTTSDSVIAIPLKKIIRKVDLEKIENLTLNQDKFLK